MNGRNTFRKNFRKVQRSGNKKSVASATNASFINLDIGDWRITQDVDGSLILYNVATGVKHSFPSE